MGFRLYQIKFHINYSIYISKTTFYNVLYCDIDIMDTLQGRTLKDLIAENGKDKICASYVGTVCQHDEQKVRVFENIHKVMCFFSIDGSI